MFKIKICGVTREEDIVAIGEAGADAVGINLVPASPRRVSLPVARELTAVARSLGLKVFIVVMNPSFEELNQILQTLSPDALQLHGEETPQCIEGCGIKAVVKALSWTGRENENALAEHWLAQASNVQLAFLVDAYAPGIGGGTGKVARWDLLKPKPAPLGHVPFLLAGGLTAENVAQAIQQTGCDGVDTASGVEASPGIKRRELVEAFVRNARQAFGIAG